MDKFKYTVMMQTLDKTPSNISLDYFEEVCLTLSAEDLEEIFLLLTERDNWPPDDASVVMQMLQVLWRYR